jgi:RecJ-like exonuclease
MPLVDCKICDSKGKIACPRCKGKGVITYGYLKELTKTCYQCNGKRFVKCDNCKGIGIVEIVTS